MRENDLFTLIAGSTEGRVGGGGHSILLFLEKSHGYKE